MKKRMKIGLFIDVFFPMIDGVVMVVDNYAKRLQKIADVTVFAPESLDKSYIDDFSYKVVRCKSLNTYIVDYNLPFPKIDEKFKKKLKESNLDIVHIHSPFAIGKIGVKYAKKHNIPAVATMHSQFKQDVKRLLKIKGISNIFTKRIIKTFNNCNECWAVNNEVARIFYEEYGYKVLPYVENNATDMTLVKNKIKSDKLINEKYRIKDKEWVFLFVGRLYILKNILFIADALKILKEKDVKFKMLYVGSGKDEEKLKKKIEENGLKNEVELCGKIIDRKLIKSIYARADLFLFPSLYDASSLVQIEAASQKTPSVFIEGAATAETIKNNINGFISKPTEKDYAEKIYEIINNKKLLTTVSEGAYKEIYRSWDDAIKEVYKKYEKLISEQKRKDI